MRLLHTFFEEQVQKNPDALAVDSFDRRLSYRWLSYYTNKIANKLQHFTVKPNTLVAVVMDKGWEQIAAVIGILKAGAAYLPIDPTESSERLSYLLKMGQVSYILTQKRLKETLKWPSNISSFSVDDEIEWDNFPHTFSPILQDANDLAYVIFTSGTTGIPKGVMIDHLGAINTISDINQRFKVNSSDKIFAASALHFDLSVYDIFGTLFAGGTIVIPTGCESSDPTRWVKIFLEKNITICNCVPALFQIFIEHLLHHFKKHPISYSLRLILLSGDWIPVTLLPKIRSLFDRADIISLGGATEASIWSVLYPIINIDSSMKSIPYGKPMMNQAIYILNEKLTPVLSGEEGELYIGGCGIAKGYWSDIERTQTAFIMHPVLGKLYKTGDIGRYLTDGNIEFLGRIDYQVKIHGFRIEISAIENCLLEYPLVKQSAVISIGQEYNRKLIAYLVLNEEYLKDDQFIGRSQVAQWHEIHNALAVIRNSDMNPTFNTLGWTSSFTGDAIPKLEMKEWVDETVKRIMDLKPQKVLEIGCGLGLLLFRIAPEVKLYDAVDYAETAIDYVKNQKEKLGIKHVHLSTCEAKDLPISLGNEYDTIILNSVVQYFSSIDYLIEVINKGISHLKPGGRVFIGDIRHVNHLRMFYSAIMLHRANQQTSFIELKNFIDGHVNNEEELLIDHRFFYALKTINPRISSVDIQLKRSNYSNEMTRFRYDVVLYLDKNPLIQEFNGDWIDWQKKYFKISSIKKILKEKKPDYLAIKNIYNKRTAGLEKIMDKQFAASTTWLEEIKAKVASMEENAINPDELYRLGDELFYNVSITWSEQPENFINVIFYKTSVNRKIIFFPETKDTDYLKPWQEYVNIPIKTKLINQSFLRIKKFLQTKLPNYMIPSKFINIDKLPMNSNGKIDRQILPTIGLNVQTSKFVAPKTTIEKSIAKTWKSVLRLDNVGIYDSFYEIGGTSLSAVMVINKIQDIFSVNLSVAEFILHSPTIHSLAKAINKKTNHTVVK